RQRQHCGGNDAAQHQGLGTHTFLTSARPNRPLGRMASTAITRVNVMMCVYPDPSVTVIKASATPKIRPAIMTPQALDMPPRIATAKAFRPNSVPMSAVTLNSGAISAPAIPASSVDTAYVTATARPMGMPISRAASRFCTTASSAVPQRVRRPTMCSAAARARPTSGISNCSGYTPRPNPDTSIGVKAHGDGRLRGSLPKVCMTTLSSTMPSATVDISQALEPRDANGRTARNSTSSPYNAQHSSASTMAGARPQPSVCANVKHSTAPNIIELPWAKFTVPDTEWVI